ncbi:MAG TPA: DUF1232 domain-containing protein [Thiotrichaceae bacterium]|jgi:uncharacterized membrane protein YkvA (DUF1232 family)|nr:DUF1232 domain-containing protein [Thiotrichaceae bacterium]HIM07010.1 DUF1232 domain-containing protein [Gammaproteobacteria bacterium]
MSGNITENIADKILLLISAMQDARTPWYAKALVILLLAYIISPIDIIPDFIPVVGFLDEIILVPIVFAFIYKLIPESVKQEINSKDIDESQRRRLKLIGVVLVLFLWLAIVSVVVMFIKQVFI